MNTVALAMRKKRVPWGGYLEPEIIEAIRRIALEEERSHGAVVNRLLRAALALREKEAHEQIAVAD